MHFLVQHLLLISDFHHILYHVFMLKEDARLALLQLLQTGLIIGFILIRFGLLHFFFELLGVEIDEGLLAGWVADDRFGYNIVVTL